MPGRAHRRRRPEQRSSRRPYRRTRSNRRRGRVRGRLTRHWLSWGSILVSGLIGGLLNLPLLRVKREEIGDRAPEIGLGDGAHVIARNLDEAGVRKQGGKVLGLAIVMVVRALEDERRHLHRLE